LPQPRSRKEVVSFESGSGWVVEVVFLVRVERWERILDSALESENQTVPVSEGFAAWFDISVV
jgi:hypothetical protein